MEQKESDQEAAGGSGQEPDGQIPDAVCLSTVGIKKRNMGRSGPAPAPVPENGFPLV